MHPGMNPNPVPRRDVLRYLGLVPLALAAPGCSTIRLAGAVVPGAMDRAHRREPAVMQAFCRTVVPVADADVAQVARVYEDPQFPLAARLPLLVRDLEGRAGGDGFDSLGGAARERIIQAGASARGPVGRLYRGAILLTQVAFYASIYDDARGCAAIDWPGAGRLPARAEFTHPDPGSFFGRSLSADGNPS